MLIAAVLYYLAGIFGFGGVDNSLVIDIQKPVKEHVTDPKRKAKVLAINETMVNQAKAFTAECAAARKELTELHARRSSTEADFNAIIHAIDVKRATLHSQLVAERLEIKGLMTASEWAQVFVVVSVVPATVSAAAPLVKDGHVSESDNQTTHYNKAPCCDAVGGRAALLAHPATVP